MTLPSVLIAYLACALLLWLPGAAIARLLRMHRARDWPLQFAVEIGVGLALWPVLFLWTSTLSWRWTYATASLCVLLLSVAGALSLIMRPRTVWRSRIDYVRRNAFWLAGFAILAALAMSIRLYQVRDLVLPAWVDPVHHTAIIRLLVDHGQLPTTLDPYVPDGELFYHWGFHSLITWLVWLSHVTDPITIANNLLLYGQILNALSIFTLYALGRYLFSSRIVGLFTAVLGIFVSWFPAYYTSWGRYPHLTGTLLLPVLIIALFRLSQRKDWRSWVTVVLLASGLFLIHVRVAFLAMVLSSILLAILLFKKEWKAGALWIIAGVATLIALLPWLIVLARSTRAETMLTVAEQKQEFWSTYNEVPWQLVWIPNNDLLLSLATAGASGISDWGSPDKVIRILSVIWLLILVSGLVVWLRNRVGFAGHALLPKIAIVVAWFAAVGFLVNLDRFGFRPLGFIHNSSVIITLFLPLSLLGGALVGWVIGCITPVRFTRLIAVVVSLSVAIWGAGEMKDIINPSTILVHPTDVSALQWISQNTDEDAGFAINVKQWQGRTYAGTDGGYWLSTLTDRRSNLPPILYATTWPPARSKQLNEQMQRWRSVDAVDDPEIRQWLQDEGIDYIFVGAVGGHLDTQKLEQSQYTETVYADGETRIFRLVE